VHFFEGAAMYETVSRSVFEDDSSAGCLSRVETTKTKVALIGSYTPRRCGIATFTADTYASLVAAIPGIAVDVYAITSSNGDVAFDAAVCGTIIDDDPTSYRRAADRINESGVDAVWLQHEFGLFGGAAGNLVLDLVNRLTAPVIVTMHTVIPDPDAAQMAVMARLVARASKLVVMSERGRDLLLSLYGADRDQVTLIPHGAPDRPFGRSDQFKAKFGFDQAQVLMTFGLLSPGKGIESAIGALPAIVARHPNLLYCIVGATHPNLIAHEGEAYRERLHALAASLGVDKHINWIDSFLETDELLDLLEAADIYVTPYLGAAQATSGTLSYAVALGKAVVSTPYVHAIELLADDYGVLVPFNDSAAIASKIGTLLDRPERLAALQKRAYARGRDTIWPAFAKRCLAVIDEVKIDKPAVPEIESIGMSGLLRICDSTGILQHSIHSVPDRAHGYCIDDNARALMLMNRLSIKAEPQRSQLAATFAAFVQSAWNDATGEFRNFMDYRRNWLEESGSEDSCGRTIWALGATALEGCSPGQRNWAGGLFDATAQSALDFGSPRAIAFSMLGADYRLKADGPNDLATSMLTRGASRLGDLFRRASQPEWPWFESTLAYDNCRLSEAMIRAGIYLNNPDHIKLGVETLRWLNDQQTTPKGCFRPVGSDSFGRCQDVPMPFDQQPVEVWAAIDGAQAGFDATGDAIWLVNAQRAYDWFGGRNDRGLVVADPVTGTCRDGINPRGLNLNEGAESVLAYQLATCAMRKMADRIG
jgi:glycosyltransferase involved in cell wall biosynthesis